ncbi:Ig-like domain-containing protein [Pseudomonas sp. C9-3]|uniref:Ig-like domain-containing protein n=1 Tax=Pseudomonas sp. C9-3 TaxID=3078264 RepID=UPI0028F0E23F|nr:Ig-like domain-containing protein [Pseudomonas sp. C9-3]
MSFEGSDKPDLTIQDFFAEGMESELYGVAEDGQMYAYVRTDGEGVYGKLLLADGESAPIALGGDSLGAAPVLNGETEDTFGFLLWPLLAGAAAVGGTTYAVYNHNQDDKPHRSVTSPEPTSAKVSDHVGPIQGDLANGAITDDPRPTISGGGMPGSIIHIIDNGVEVGSTSVASDGHWSFVPTSDLGGGHHSIDVTQSVPGEKPSAPLHVIDFDVDVMAPSAPEAHLDPSSSTGSDGGNTISNVKPTIDGKTEPGADITVSFPSGEEIHTKADQNGDWSVTPTQPLSEGQHDITVIATDPAGNASDPTIVQVVIDTIAPIIPNAWLDPASDSGVKGDYITNDTKPTIDGKTEPGADITVSFPSGEKVHTKADQNGDWSVTPTQPLSEGQHDITIIATDPAGNASDPNVIHLVIDSVVPDAGKLAITGVLDSVGSVTGNVADKGTTDDSRPQISGTGNAGDTVIVYTKDATGNHELGRATVGADGTWSLQPGTPLIAGLNELTAVEMDAAGNKTAPSSAYDITLDASKPLPPVINSVLDDVGPIQGLLQKGAVTDDNQPTFSGSAEPGSTVKLYDGGKLIGSGLVDSKGNWSITTDTLADGPHNVTATATNPVGVISDATGGWNFSVDTTAPSKVTDPVAIDHVGDKTGPLHNGDTTDDNRPTLGGSAEPGSKVIISDNGTPIGSATVGEDGKWEFTPTTPLAEGSHDLTTEVQDPAGNLSGPSDPLHIVVDTSKVVVQITHVIDDIGSIKGDIAANASTDDQRPEIQGSGKAGSTVTVSDGSTVLGSTVVKADGTWSFTPSSDLADGAHSITATATDAAGNTSPATPPFAFNIDTIAPSKPAIGQVTDDVGSIQGPVANGGVTDDPNPTLSGTAEAGSTVTVYDNGSKLGSVVADKDGNWSYTPTTPISEGAHSFTVDATDKAGNVSAKSDPFTLNTDYTAPDAGKLAITGVLDSVGSVTGNVADKGTTDDSRPQISGTGNAGDTVIVYTKDATGNHELGRATVGADGTWSLQPGTPLIAGLNELTAVEMDAAGNKTAPSSAYDITLDASKPLPPVINSVLDDVGPIQGLLQKGAVTDDNQPTFSGSAEPGSTVKLYDGGKLIGSGLVDSKGNWSITTDTLADGPHNVTATATNPVGVISDATGGWNFSVDTTAPSKVTDPVAIDHVGDKTGPLHNGDTTDDNRPTLGGSAEPGSKVIISDNGTPIGSATVGEDGKWEFTPTTPLAEGSHDLTTEVQDPAGNLSGPSDPLHIVVDTSKVVVQITHVIDDIGSIKGDIAANASTDDQRPEIQGSGKAGSTVTVSDGSTVLGSTVVKADGTWSFTPSSDLADGAHSITATATDAAGNTSPATPPFAFNIDTIAPSKPAIGQVTDDVGSIQGPVANGGVTDDPNPTLSGTAEAGSTVTVYDNGSKLGSVVADKDGNWSYTPTTPISEGAHSFTVDATDKAGNVSAKSDPFTLNTDYTAPDAGKLAITGVLDSVGSVTGNVADKGTTDDSRPQISGTGNAGDTVIVYTKDATGNHELGRATVGADGTWSLQPGTPLIAGLNELTAVEMDAAGNKTAPSSAYDITLDASKPLPPVINSVLDDVGPIQGLLQKGAVTDDNQPTFSGSAEPGSTVKLYDGGKLIGSGLVDSKGNWSITTDTLADGPHNVTATATNPVGVISDATGGWNFSVDTTAPSKVTDPVAIDHVGDKTGPLHNGDTTDDNRPTLGGSAEPGSKVIISDNGTPIGSATVGEDGKWEFTPTTPLAEGSHDLTTEVQDPAGNLSGPSDPLHIVVDTSKVVVQITHVIDDIGSIKGDIAANASTDDQRPEIQGSGKAGSTVTVSDGSTVLGSTVVKADGTWSFTPSSDLADGAHSITATATDAAGNTSPATPPFAFNIDTIAPSKPAIGQVTDDVGSIQGPVANGGVTDDPNPTLSGTAEAGSTVTVYDNGSKLGSVVADKDGNWSYTPTTPISEGAHSFTVDATDKAGNVSAKSDPFTLNTDYTAPDAGKLAITGVLDSVGSVTGNVADKGTTDDSRPQISGTGNAGDTVIVYTKDATGNHELGRATVGADGTWSLQPGTPLIAGLNELTAVEMDAAGNKTAPSSAYDITLDASKPLPPVINSVLDDVGPIQGLLQKGAVTDDNQPTFSGSAEPGSTVKLYDGGKLIGSGLVDSKGNWSITTDTLADGPHNVTATATNPVGVISDATGGWNFSVDTTAPSKVTDPVAIDHVGDKTGPLHNGDTTDDNRPTLGGSAEPGSKVIISDNGTPIGSATVGEDGKWEFTPTTPLAEGSHDLTTEVQDPAGNLSGPSDPLHIVVDTSKVVVQITHVIDDIGSIKGDIAANASTDDQRPEIQGSGKAGSTVTVSDGSTVLGSTVVKADGTWSFTPSSDLADGAHSITATATDAAGNTSPATPPFAFNIDTIAPSKPAIGQVTDDVGSIQGPVANGGVTDDPNPTLSGTAEAGSTVTVYDNGSKLGSVVADKDGNWSYTPTTPISEGAHSFTVDATDKAGNVSAKSDPFTLNTDYTAPDAGKLAITGVLDSVGSVTGNVADKGTTDDSRPQISGTGNAGDTVIVYTKDATGNHELGRATVGADGTWSLQPGTPLIAGLNELTAVEMDAAGNKTAPSSAYDITLDASKPLPPVINSVLDDVGPIQGLLQKGAVTDDNQPTFSGSAEPGSTVKLYDGGKLIGSGLVDSKGNWSITTDTLADGPHNVTATATNPVGVISDATGGWNFSVDTTAPSKVTDPVAIDHVGDKTGPLHNGDTTDDNRPTLGGSAEPGSKVIISDNGTPIGSATVGEDGKWEFTPTTPLAEGSHDLTTEVQDPAGNLSGPSDPLHIVVDTSKVVVQITHVIDDIGSIKGDIAANASTDDQRPEIQGSGKAGSTVTVSDGSTVLGSTVVKADGTWSFTPSSDLADGAHSITATATDAAGNTSPATPPFAFNIDTIAPSKPAIGQVTDDVGSIQGPVANGGVTDDPNPTLSGTAEAGSTVTVYDNGSKLGSVVADKDGNWSYTPTTPISEGAHSFTVDATDKAGNVSAKSDPFTLNTDYTAPDAGKLAITGVLDSVGSVTGNVADKGTTDDSRPQISGTGNAGDTVIVYTKDATGNHELGRATVGADGTWSLQPGTPLIAGLNELTAVEMDAAGNKTAPSSAYDITLDASKPLPPVINSVLDDVGPIQGLLQKGAVTDDNQPTFSGSAEPGSTVKLYDGGKLIGSGLVDSKGNWSITTDTLADGPHNVTATATNPVGVISDATGGWNFSVDTTAPSKVTDPVAIDHVGDKTGPLHNGDTTDDNRPTLGGSAEPGSKVIISDNGTPIGSATVGEDGKWEFTPTTPLAEGSHDLTTEVQDPAGNLSGPSDPLHIVVDTSKVVVQITHVIDDIGSIKGDIAANASTDDQRPEIQGSGKAGSTVTVSDGSTVLGSTVVKADGTWSFTPSSDLADGAHSITATATDAAGNTSPATPPFAFNIDTIAPSKPAIGQVTDDVGSIQGPVANGGVTDDPNPTLSGTAEAGSTVTVYDNGSKLGSVVADKDGNWSYTPTTPISEGAHSFTVDATDKAGNVSAKSDPFTLNTDYTAPDAGKLAITGVLDSVGSVTGNVADKGTTDDSRPQISGTGNAGDTVIVYTKDATGNHELGRATVGADGTWSLQPGTPLIAGLNELTAVEMDAAGNKTAPSSAYDITLDASKPLPPVINSVLDDVGPIQGLLQKGAVTDDNQPTFSGSAEPGSTVKLYDGGKLIGSGLVDSKGNWSITTDTLADGPHNVTATATNPVGVISDATGGWNFSVDTTAPSKVTDPVAIDHVGDKTGPLHNGDTTDDNRPTLGGSAEPGSKVIISDNGTPIGSATVGEDGKWEFTPTTPLAEGSHDLTTEVQDPAGNLSGPSDPLHIVVDTSKVVVQITHVIDDIGSIKGDIAANASTDDQRPEIQGSGKAGSTVTVSDGSTVLGSTVVKADGTWSFTPSSDLADGAHSITATATDAAGNTSPATPPFAFNIDTIAPSKPAIGQVTDDVGSIQGPVANGGVTDDPNPTLSGTAEAGSTVTVYDNGSKLGSVVADKDGNWSYTPTTPISEGAHSFTVDATDKAGNVSAKSDPFTLNTDYTAPDAGKLAITGVLDSVGSVTGNVADKGTTDDSRPQISGTGNAGDTVIVYTKDATGNHELGRATVGADGTWSLQPGTPLIAGLNELTAVEMDAAGNKTAPSSAYDITLDASKPLPPVINSVLDDVGPIQGLLQKGAVTDDNQPTFSGSAEPGSTVKLYDGGKLIGSGLVDSKGNWSITTDTLADGPHNVTATATNPVGVISDATGGWNFSVDTTAPSKVTDPVAIDHVGDKTGPLHNGDTTDDNRPTLGGSAEPGSKVIISDNGTPIGSATVGEDGKWEFTPTTPLAEGSHDLTTEVQDPAGNLSGPSDPLHIVVDTSKVVVQITHVIDDIGSIKGDIAANASTDDQRPEIQGSGKAGSTVTVSDGSTVLGSTVVKADGTWSFTPSSDLADGAHSITATATDAAGNTSPATPPFAFNIDTIAPSKPAIGQVTDDVGSIQGPVANGGVTDDPNPTLSGTAEAGSTVTVYDNGSKLGSVVADKDGNWSYTPTTPISEGAHSFTVDATDKAGNVSAKSDPFTLNTDYTAPDAGKLAITGVLDSVGSVTGNVADKGTTDDSRPQISGTGNAGDTVIVYTKDATGNHELGRATVGADGTWSLQPGTPLIAGLNELTAVEMDAAGNKTAPSSVYDITLDTTPPAKPVIESLYDDGSSKPILPNGDTADTTPQISGSAEAGSLVVIKDGAKVIGSTTADAGGKWSFTPATPLSSGDHALTVDATDKAGNTSVPSDSFNFSITPGGDDYPRKLNGGDEAPLSYTVILDTSGSMAGTGMSAAKTALLAMLTTALKYGSTVTFNLIELKDAVTDYGYFTFSSATDASYTSLVNKINGLSASGSENYEQGLKTALTNMNAELTTGTVPNKQVFFISDGNPAYSNLEPTPATLANWQAFMHTPPNGHDPISVTTIGLGSNISDKFLSKITTDATVMSPSIPQLSDIMQAHMYVDSVGGNVLANDSMLHRDGAEHLTQIKLGASTYQITAANTLAVDKPDSSVSSTYDGTTGRLILNSDTGCLTIYMKGSGAYKAGDYLYQLRPADMPLGVNPNHEVDYQYTGVDSDGHSQSATLHIVFDSGSAGAIHILSMTKDSGVAGDFITADGTSGRAISGDLSQKLAAGNFLEISLDGGKSWNKVTAVDGTKWAYVDKTAHASDWAVQVRVSDGTGSAYLTEQAVKLSALAKAPAITSILEQDNDGLYTATEANAGAHMVVSLAGTGAKAGDILHTQWGIAQYDKTLTALDISSGQVAVQLANTVTSTAYNGYAQGVLYNFDVTTSIIHDGVAGASSAAYHLVGGGFSTRNVGDNLYNTTATAVTDNSYTGDGFTVTTHGAAMAKAAQVTNKTYAGLMVSDPSSADMVFTLSKSATQVGFALSGLDNTSGGALVIVYGVDGTELSRQTVTGSGAYSAYNYSYTAAPGHEVGSFKVVSGTGSLTLSNFSETQALHVADTRTLVIDEVTDSFYGTPSDDTVSLTYSAANYFASTSNTGIHGGAGVDTLKLVGNHGTLNLELPTSVGKLSGMEVVDITGFNAGQTTGASNAITLNLSVKDVLENGQTDLFHSSDQHTVQMMVKGDSNDTVNLDHLLGSGGANVGTWSDKGPAIINGSVFEVYQHSGLDAELLVQYGVHVNLV